MGENEVLNTGALFSRECQRKRMPNIRQNVKQSVQQICKLLGDFVQIPPCPLHATSVRF